MYRILAIVWLVVGVGWIVYDASTGNPAISIPGLGFSPGWVCVLLSLYNFVRWWGRRQSRAHREAEYHARLESHYRRHPPPVRLEPSDPNFDFSDKAPQQPAEQPKPESRE
jgi:hypothetical protein